MNKEYTYIDGKVIVEDTEGNKRPVEYSDNLNEILVEENIIETLENNIKRYEEESKIYQKNYKYNKIYPWITLGIFTITPTIAFKIIFPLIFGTSTNNIIFDTFIGPMSSSTLSSLFFTVYLTPLGILLSNSYFRRNKYKLKIEKGRQLALESLKEELDLSKQKLEKLNQEKTVVNEAEKGFKLEKVKDEEVINHIYKSINLYQDLGYNGEKYYKYYQKHGKLPKKTQEQYTELEQMIVFDYLEDYESYLEEKGHMTLYIPPKTRIRKRK